VPLLQIAGLAAVGVLAWFWLDSIKARDIAVSAARRACAAEGLQFLDDSVSAASVRPARDGAGRLHLRRVYNFEFSDTGNNRLPGGVELLGHRLMAVNLALVPPAATTLH
jgi:hypothetical protein